MSTKLFNGVRFASGDLGKLHSQLMELRAALRKSQRKGVLAWIASSAQRIVDSHALGIGALPEKPPLLSVLSDLMDRQAEVRKSGRRDREVDWDFDLTVLPWKGGAYGLVYAERAELREILLGQKWVEEFRYWDNGDPPDGMPEEEWEARRQVWDGILSQDHLSRPVACGLSFEAEAEFFCPSDSELAAAMPSLDERVHHHATNRVVSGHMRRQQESFDGPASDWAGHHAFRAAMNAMDYTRTEAGMAEIATASAEIAAILSKVGDVTLPSGTQGLAPDA